MGTTSQKLSYLNGTKQKLKQSINALGGSIDDETTFREYANQLDGIYDAIPKTEYQSGSEVNLGKTIKGKLDFKKEYQAVEYIECDGGQHIDTGYIPNYNTKIEAEFAHNEYTKDTPLFGVRDSNYLKAYIFWSHPIEYDNNHQSTAQFNSTTTAMNNFTVGTKIKAVYDNQGVIYGGVNYPWPQEPTQGSPNLNLIILGLSNGGNIDGRKFSGKLWYFKIWNSDVLVRDFIPCYRISDNVIGLYDKVEGKFYTSLGSGTLTKGADVGDGFNEIVGVGQSSQKTTNGRQLLDINATSFNTQTRNGVTITNNGDGSITLNGTATDNTGLKVSAETETLNDKTGTFSFSMNMTGSVTGTLSNIVYGNSGTAVQLTVADGGHTFTKTTTTETYNKCYMWIWFANGTVLNNVTIKPMFTQGDYTAQTMPAWEEYSGGYTSPSLDWEQQVKCVAGRNKLKNPRLRLGNVGITLTENDDGTIILNGTNASSTEYVDFDIDAKKGVSYAVSFLNGETVPDYGAGFRFNFYNKNNQNLSDVGLTGKSFYFVNLAENSPRAGMWIQAGNTFDNVKLFPQVEEKNFTSFKPYNTVDGTIKGLNKLPWGTITGNTTTEYTFNPVLEAGTYSFSFNAYNPNGGKALDFLNANNTSIKNVYMPQHTTKTYQFTTFTVAEPISKVRIYSGSAEDEISEIMLVKGGYTQVTMPSFEPYVTPKTYQFSLGDYEFHGIENYKDKILCDLENEKVYKYENVGEIVLDGTNTTLNAKSGTSNNNLFYTSSISNMVTPENNDQTIPLYSNYFIKTNINNMFVYDIPGVVAHQSGMIGIGFALGSGIDTVEKANNWLTTHNTTVYYPLLTTIKTEITGTLKDQIIAWCKAHSTNETTIIEMDGDLPLLIEVRGLKGAA